MKVKDAYREYLMSKFPEFRYGAPQEVQLSWFRAYLHVMWMVTEGKHGVNMMRRSKVYEQ